MKSVFYFPQKKSLHKKNSHPVQSVYGNVQPVFDLRVHEVNISNGAEFLDDKIRMKEQPLGNAGPGFGFTG